MKDNNPRHVQNQIGQKREPTPSDCMTSRSCSVKRTSGLCVVLGLIGGSLIIQGAIVGYYHWTDANKRADETNQALWQALIESQSKSSPTANPPAFYPPPGWDGGLFSKNKAGEARATGNAAAPYSLDTVLEFLHQLRVEDGTATPHRTPVTLEQGFRQASTAHP